MLNLPGYRITETLYTSGISTVYRARHEQRGDVVLKTTTSAFPRPAVVARLRRELAHSTSLDLPGVVSYLDAVEVPGSLVLVLEDFGAVSLSELLHLARFTPCWCRGFPQRGRE